MSYVALLYMVISSSCIGIMSQLRKVYQIRNGIGMISTMLFSMLVSIVASTGGWALGAQVQFEKLTFTFALLYAILSTVTASLCICGTAFGNLAVLVLYATLGSLVIPSTYGLIVLPEENILTPVKVMGFLLAFLCLALNFIKSRHSDDKKSTAIFKLLCLLVFVTNGSALVVYNLENRYCNWYSYYSFITEYMMISAILLLIVLSIYFFKSKERFVEEARNVFGAKSILIIVGYAALFFTSDLLAIKCAGMIPLIIQAPISFCIPLIVTVVLDYAIYREKLNRVHVLQMATALLCAICFIV